MRTMLEYTDSQRSRIIAELGDADDAARIRRALDNHLVRMLTAYNEDCPSDILREYAASLVTLGRSALSWIDSGGEIRIWEEKKPSGTDRKLSGKGKILFVLLTALGVIALAAACVMILSLPGKGYLGRIPAALLLPAAGGVCLFMAGLIHGKGNGPGSGENLKTQLTYDKDKIFRHLREIIMTMDKCLGDLDASQRARERVLSGKQGNMLPDEKQLSLYADLLEAGAARDADSALDAIETLRYYLHSQGIETVDEKDGQEEWFEYMPSDREGTIRPALVREGVLLKKGLAAVTVSGKTGRQQ